MLELSLAFDKAEKQYSAECVKIKGYSVDQYVESICKKQFCELAQSRGYAMALKLLKFLPYQGKMIQEGQIHSNE